jgi:hypothetical protein
MSKKIDHQFLDLYESVKGEFEKLDTPTADADLWELVDQLLLDLHMIRFGYTTEGYEKYVDRRLQEVCADSSVADRIKDLKL